VTRIRRRRFVLAALATVVLAGVAVFLLAVGGDDGRGQDVEEGGPLAVTADTATATSFPAELGAPYSWGATPLVNDGDEPATIERIELMVVPAAMRVVGMYALPGLESGIGSAEGFDPGDWPNPTGLVIEPGQAYELVVGAQIEEAGRFLMPGVRIHYRVGEDRYQATLNHALAMCGPPERYTYCPAEAEVRY
jgi:hypothetical protein